MKRILFLLVALTLSAACMPVVGQELIAKRGLNGKWGFINKVGKEVIPYKYDDAWGFSEGLARVKLNNKWGFIDNTGKEVIPCKYDETRNFFEGLATVQLNGKYGIIDKTGWEVVPIIYENREIAKVALKTKTVPFSAFAKKYVEQKINDWQEKGEFEKTVDWQQRVNETTRNVKVAELTKEAEKVYILEQSKDISIGNMTLGAYDADNEIYLIKNSEYGNWLVPVPIKGAQSFKDNFYKAAKTPKYFISNDNLAIAEMTFTLSGGKTYKYSNQASLNYTVAKIDCNFSPIELNLEASNTPQGNQNISTVNVNVGKSDVDVDVDVDIPINAQTNNKTFAVIIANENYQSESLVMFANNDGTVFKEYCTKTLGIPEKNIRSITNATLNNIRAAINWISEVAQAFNGEANIIFYYAGHGIPDESSKTAYLLPIDGYGSDPTTGYKLDDLYTKLGSLPAKQVIVFMDACFSGSQRSGDMLASARGVAIKAVQGKPSGNMVVFSATQGDETAYPYQEKGHGLFTYFLLKKLQESKGEITLGELSNYITANVKQQSIVVNSKSQTPTVTPSASMGGNWKSKKLK